MKAGFYHLLVCLSLALVLVGCSQTQTQVLKQGISVDTSGLSGNSDSSVDASVSAGGKSVADGEEADALERTKAAMLRQKKHGVVDNNDENSLRLQQLNENLRQQKHDEQLKAMYAEANVHADKVGRYVNDVSELTAEDLVWISTIEGLTAHYDMMKRFWAWAVASGRNLVVASYKSAHYPGVKMVDLCAIFNLPETVKCIGIRRNVLIQKLKCTVAPEEPDKSPGDYGLHANFSMSNLPMVNWNESECVIGTGRSQFFMGLPGAKTHMKIEFSEKSVSNYQHAFDMLFSPGPKGQRNDYTVAHWRRSFLNQHTNAPCRHNDKDDERINCGAPENLLGAVKTANYTKIGRVYVATNERRAAMLDTVRKAGLKLLADTRNRVVGGQKLNSLDAFVVDVQMMVQADHYMSWGKSAVRSFVERARVQRAKSIMEGLKRKKELEEAEAELRTFYIIVALPIILTIIIIYISCCKGKNSNNNILPIATQGIEKGKDKEKAPPISMEEKLKAGKLKSKTPKSNDKRNVIGATNRKKETIY